MLNWILIVLNKSIKCYICYFHKWLELFDLLTAFATRSSARRVPKPRPRINKAIVRELLNHAMHTTKKSALHNIIEHKCKIIEFHGGEKFKWLSRDVLEVGCNFVPAIDEGANGNIYEVEIWNERKVEMNEKKVLAVFTLDTFLENKILQLELLNKFLENDTKKSNSIIYIEHCETHHKTYELNLVTLESSLVISWIPRNDTTTACAKQALRNLFLHVVAMPPSPDDWNCLSQIYQNAARRASGEKEKLINKRAASRWRMPECFELLLNV